jgi:hypothetical protein
MRKVIERTKAGLNIVKVTDAKGRVLGYNCENPNFPSRPCFDRQPTLAQARSVLGIAITHPIIETRPKSDYSQFTGTGKGFKRK